MSHYMRRKKGVQLQERCQNFVLLVVRLIKQLDQLSIGAFTERIVNSNTQETIVGKRTPIVQNG